MGGWPGIRFERRGEHTCLLIGAVQAYLQCELAYEVPFMIQAAFHPSLVHFFVSASGVRRQHDTYFLDGVETVVPVPFGGRKDGVELVAPDDTYRLLRLTRPLSCQIG